MTELKIENGKWKVTTHKVVRVAFVVLSLSIFNFQFSTAQKFPERRTTRQGTKLYVKGDYAGAEARYRRAMELNASLREAGFNLGNVMWRQAQVAAQEAAQEGETGEEQQAVQGKAKAATDAWMGIAGDSLAPLPMVSAASYNLGNASLAGQQIDQAIEFYKQSLRIAPGDMEAKFNLAYAQKLKQQQENRQQDQNQDQQDQNQNQDQNDSGDQGDDDQDQNNDRGDGQDDQNDEREGDDNPRDGENSGDGENGGEGDQPPPPPSEGDGKGGMDPGTAEQMLDAMQAAEDDTREKVNAKEVQVGAQSGKNW